MYNGQFIVVTSGIFEMIKVANAATVLNSAIYEAYFLRDAFFVNISSALLLYVCVIMIYSGFYLKSPKSKVVGAFFSGIGNIVSILLVSFVSIAIFRPIEAQTLFYASAFAAIMFFLIISLSNFRKYVLFDENKKKTLIMRFLLSAFVAFFVIFGSAFFSIKTRILNIENSYDKYKQQIWFRPYMQGACEIQKGSRLIETKIAEENCFYYDNMWNFIRIPCPVTVSSKDLAQDGFKANERISIKGRGSCNEIYDVLLTDKGIKIYKQQ